MMNDQLPQGKRSRLESYFERCPLGFLPPPWQPYGYLFVVVLPLLVLQSHQQSLMAHDEGIYGFQASQILKESNWIDPANFNYDRTIGIQWLIALCYQWAGVSEGVSRFPSMVAAILSTGLTYRLGSLFLGPTTGFLGALILITTHLWAQYTKLATQDLTLVCLELIGFWGLAEAGRLRERMVERSPHGSHTNLMRNLWLTLAGSTLGLGFLIKGFMIFPAGVAALPYLILGEKYQRHLRSWGLYLGMVLGWIPVTLWLGLSVLKSGSWLPVENLFGKLFYLAEEVYFDAGPTYYLWNVPLNMFPWFIFTLWGTVILLHGISWQRLIRNDRGLLMIVAFPWTLLGLLTCFTTRTRYYPLQIMPFFALIAGVGLVALGRNYLARDRSVPPSHPQGNPWELWLSKSLTYGLGALGLTFSVVGLGWVGASLYNLVPPEQMVYGVIALAWGLPWIGLLILPQSKKIPRSRSFLPWLSCWFLGPWLAIVVLNLSGLWGNYNPTLKTFLEQPLVEQINQTQTITRMVAPELDAHSRKVGLLLAFYTHNQGAPIETLTQLQPLQYCWVSPNVEFPANFTYHNLGNADSWQLIQAL